jgi:hypothetical protein
MPHQVEKHPTLPVIIRRYDESLNLAEIEPESRQVDTDLINALKEKIYYIMDIRELSMSFDDLLKASSLASRKDSNMSHPNIIETLVVVPNRMLEIAAQGLRTASFGNLRVRPFRSMEEALEYVKQKTAAS